MDKRIKTAVDLGYTRIFGPVANYNNKSQDNTIQELTTIQETVKTVFKVKAQSG